MKARCKDIHKLYQSQSAGTVIHKAYTEVSVDDMDELRYNRTPLHLACEFIDAEAVRILLERGTEVNTKDDKGITPLCLLAMLHPGDDFDENAIVTITQLLLKHGANVSRSGNNTTALLEAVRHHHHGMVETIINSGINLDSTDSDGENALHIACREAGNAATHTRRWEEMIENSALKGYSEKQKEQIQQELERQREEEFRCNETVRKLLESGQFDAEDKNNNGKTASDIAMEYGAKWIGSNIFQALYSKNKEALKALLRSGTELQTVCEDRRMPLFYGNSPLACALMQDDMEAAEILLHAGADPNYKMTEEQTAFAVWISTNKETCNGKEPYLRILQLMTQYGWQPDQETDKEGNTALSLACRYAHSTLGHTVIDYLATIGANVNAGNRQGQTPIMNLYGGRYWDGKIPHFPGLPRSYPYEGRTCSEEDAEILELLLKTGADISNTDKWGNTVLHYIAASARHHAAKKAVETLFAFGQPAIETVNNEGKTAIDIAAEKNDEVLVKFLLKYA